MRIVVSISSAVAASPHSRGRYYDLRGLFAHSLLWDPILLSACSAVPMVRVPDDSSKWADEPGVVLFYSHATPAADELLINRLLRQGGAAVLNTPEPELLQRGESLRWLGATGAKIESLRERWDLGRHARGRYYWTDQDSYYRLDPSRGRALTQIGDCPGIVIGDRVAVFAGDPWVNVVRYLNVPAFDQLLLDLASVLAEVIAAAAGKPLGGDVMQRASRWSEIRRDFHSFGFAFLTVRELARCNGKPPPEMADAAGAAIEAAKALVTDDADSSTSELRRAFRHLASHARALQPTPAIFTDTLHASGLFGELGYFEFDWPQHAADMLEKHLDWAERRGYRFNVDCSAGSVERLAERFPILFRRLRDAQRRGLVEFVNGTYSQPYPPFYTLESQIRQIDSGQAVFERLFNRRVSVYASQEFGFAPAHASVLAQHGYAHAVLRVQNMGDAPTVDAARATWIAPNGRELSVLPSHPYKSEQLNEVTYNNLHLKLYAQAEASRRPAVFSGLGDLTYYRPFREELARTAHYADVFGAFHTWSDYFARPVDDSSPRLKLTMDSFDCRAAFLDVRHWGESVKFAGEYNARSMRAAAASDLFVAAEMLDAITAGNGHTANVDRDAPWKALANYQGHDAHIASRWSAGGFMGGVTDPPSVAQKRTSQTVTDYCGPWDSLTYGKRCERDLAVAEREARRSIRRRLRKALSTGGPEVRFAIFNPGPPRRRRVRLPGHDGTSLACDGRPVRTQRVGVYLFAEVDLPAYGICFLRAAGADDEQSRHVSPLDHVRAGDDSLENAFVRVEFDPSTGHVTRLFSKSDNAELLDRPSHVFTTRRSDHQRVLSTSRIADGPLLAGVEWIIDVSGGARKRFRIRSRMTLAAGESYCRFDETLLRASKVSGDPWEGHLAVQFNVAGTSTEVRRCHFNVLERSEASKIFSLNVLTASAGESTVSFINRGQQFYRRDGNTISNILFCQNETATRFRYAVGRPEGNPVAEARRFVRPCFVRRATGTPETSSQASWPGPFAQLDSEDAEISSITRTNDGMRIRLANLSAGAFDLKLRIAAPVVTAWATDLRGQEKLELRCIDGTLVLPLRPWDIRQVEIKLERST